MISEQTFLMSKTLHNLISEFKKNKLRQKERTFFQNFNCE